MMYKVIRTVIFTIIDNYNFLYSMVFYSRKVIQTQQYLQKDQVQRFIWVGNNGGFMNNISCPGFSKYSILTVVLTCLSALVPYYLSKTIFIAETEEGSFDIIPKNVYMQIHADNLHHESSLLNSQRQFHRLSTHWTSLLF